MLSPILGDLATSAHEERLRIALVRADYLRAFDGCPTIRPIRLAPRAQFGARVMRAGAWIGGIDLEWGADRPQPSSRPATAL